MKQDIGYSFNLGDWITLKEKYMERMKKNEDGDIFNLHYKYAKKVMKISHNIADYPIYHLEPGNYKTISPEVYRLATDKEIIKAKLNQLFT